MGLQALLLRARSPSPILCRAHPVDLLDPSNALDKVGR